MSGEPLVGDEEPKVKSKFKIVKRKKDGSVTTVS